MSTLARILNFDQHVGIASYSLMLAHADPLTEVTQILKAIEQGDAGATSELLPLVYAELRRLAAFRLKQQPAGQTLQPTALVHEAFLRLVNAEEFSGWDSRGHFFAAASEAMRQIVIDEFRRKKTLKRGGDWNRVNIELSDVPGLPRGDELLSLDDALDKLEKYDSRKCQIVKMRFFGGLTTQQAADAIGISLATAERDWNFARAWLRREISTEENSPQKPTD